MNYGEIIAQWQKRVAQYKGIKRLWIQTDTLRALPKIITLLWWRRVGKTYTLIQIIRDCIAQWYCKLEQIIFIDIAELDHQHISIQTLHTYILDQWITNPVYCFDEIQELADFDRQLIYLFNQWVKIFITGSNSKLLSQELTTVLRWRTYEVHQTLLSFQEFLLFKWHDIVPNDIILENLFDEYVKRGGYPEVVLSNNETVKKWILQWYIDLLIYKDLIDRYAIRNHAVLQAFIKQLIISNSKELNVHKIYLWFKSQWFEIGKNTLYEYLQYIKHTFFISALAQFYKKTLFEKHYIIDTGLMQCFSNEENRWQKFETVIYHHLTKKEKMIGFVQQDYEIDFTNGENNRQVCRELNIENYSRESKFSIAKWKNYLITRHSHTFTNAQITMMSRKELMLW